MIRTERHPARNPAALHRSPIMHRTICVLLLLCASFASADLTTTGEKKKKKKDDAEFIPEAKPVNARFITGIPVDIELNAATPKLGGVRFIIREQPQHGTLSAIRPNTQESFKAVVTYTPNPGSTVLADRFTYAVKMEEGSWSAPSAVTLTGQLAKPKVEIMEAPTFGRILPKAEGSSRLVLKNTGIAPFASDIQWQAPWKGPPRIELGIGEQKEYLIMVTPTAPGTLIWETELQPGEPRSRVKLYVECSQPFMVAPGLLKLQYDAKTGNRHGKVGIANSSQEKMMFQIQSPDRLRAPKQMEVAAKQTADVELSLATEDVRAFRGELWVVNEPYRERVTIDAAPEPAQVVLVTPADGQLDLGSVAKGRGTQAKITVMNVGGEAGVMAGQISPPFRVAETDAALSVAPGESREVTIEATSETPGKYTGNLVLSGTGGKLSVVTKLAVTDPNMPQSIKPNAANAAPKSSRAPVARSKAGIPPLPPQTEKKGPASKPGDGKTSDVSAKPGGGDEHAPAAPGEKLKLSDTETALMAYVATFGMPTPPEMRSDHLQKIDGIELVKQGRDQLVLAWKEPTDKPDAYRFEQGYRVLNQPTGMWLKAWREVPDTEVIKGEEGKHTVRVSKLLPEARYEFRVLGQDSKGKVSEPSDIHFFSTLPPWRAPSWMWQSLVAVALVIFIFIYVKLKRGSWAL